MTHGVLFIQKKLEAPRACSIGARGLRRCGNVDDDADPNMRKPQRVRAIRRSGNKTKTTIHSSMSLALAHPKVSSR